MALVTFLIVGCSEKDNPEDPIASFISSSCTFNSVVPNHDFRSWPSEDANKYTCTIHSKMDCALYLGADAIEIRCQGINPADPNNVPDDCDLYGSGTRTFFSGNIFTANSYSCDDIAGIRCFYIKYDGPPVEEDFQCSS